jgi:hypothetical protein
MISVEDVVDAHRRWKAREMDAENMRRSGVAEDQIVKVLTRAAPMTPEEVSALRGELTGAPYHKLVEAYLKCFGSANSRGGDGGVR